MTAPDEDTAHHAIPGASCGQTRLALFVDADETYGSHIFDAFLSYIPSPRSVLDIGAGSGRDLGAVRAHFPEAALKGVDCSAENIERLRMRGIEGEAINIETQRLPYADESLDLVLANQVMEHTKEVFWIFHEISRVLKVGGHFYMGVPNVASFHNRLLLLFGVQPTQHKLYSAHVRPFSKNDTLKFMDVCWPGGYALTRFGGSQFYPFPPLISRPLCRLAPAAAVTIFFLFRKLKPYDRAFLEHPVRAKLETNFFLG
jgi:SAM-dependent methyltransferase